MSNFRQERENLINEFNSLEKTNIKRKKEIILELAKNIEQTLNTPEIINLLKLENLPQQTDSISQLIYRIKKKNGWSIGRSWINMVLPQKYKIEKAERGGISETVRLSDNYIREHAEELRERIKDIVKGPAKDIKPKERVSDLEKYDWRCWVAQELAKLAIKLETEHETHDSKLCQEYAKRMKSIRDKRFATNINNYEAMIVGANFTTSLSNVVEGNWEFKTFWDIVEDMKKCRECLGFGECEREKCPHECHRVVRPMTTKGYKYAIKTDEYLKEFDKHIQYLSQLKNELCRIGKVIIEYKQTEKFLDKPAKKRLFNNHLERDECLQCEMFFEKNPHIFD